MTEPQTDQTWRQFVEMLGGDPDGQAYEHSFTLGPVSLEQLSQAGADLKDGAALRKLREALPGHVVTVKADAMAYGRGWLVSAEDGPARAMYALEGTIAEAADKCREALEVTDD